MRRRQRPVRRGLSVAAVIGTVLMGVTSLLVLTSSSGQEPSLAQLLGRGPWRLAGMLGQPLVTGSEITISFDEPNTFTGRAGVNYYRGTFTRVGSNGLTVGDLATTAMAGPPLLMEQEGKYLGALGQITQFRFDNRILEMLQGSQVLLRFTGELTGQ
jgi:heat shock protein HslJ